MHAAALHRDVGNSGPPVIHVLGEFTGGNLWWWPDDDGASALGDVPLQNMMQLGLDRFAQFDGNCAHMVEPFEGERFSIIFFSTAVQPRHSAVKSLEKLQKLDVWHQ